MKEKSSCYFHKKLKILKNPKNPLLVGFFRLVFLGIFGWVFLGGFFNANPEKKPSALKRGHPTLQNMNFYKICSTFEGHFCPPGSGSGSTDPIESGSNPDPQPCFLQLEFHSRITGAGLRTVSGSVLFWEAGSGSELE